MSKELLRWRETSMDPSALPARAADLVDAARDVPALPREALARIHARVAAGARRPARLRGLPLGLRLATLTALALLSVATAKGAVRLWYRYVVVSGPTAPHHAARARTASAPKPQPRVETAPLIEAIDLAAPASLEAPEAEPAPEPAGAPEPTPRRPRRAAAPEPRAPAEAPAPADAAGEAQLLADALARLRQARDPRGALVLLDQYAKAYPRGVLASEARRARLEAMLKLDDRQGALALLDGRAAFVGRLGVEELLTRAELRASVGRYADALGDFDRLLAPSAALAAPPPAELERALYGRAVTLGHVGRDDRARADLEAYQRRFPDGKHAAEVARLLNGAPR
jgi:hypothetical protein